MSADPIFTDEKRTENREDRSAIIFVVGRVAYTPGGVQLDAETRLHCRRAVKEYYQRTKVINRRRNGSVVDTRLTNKVYLVIVSFDRRARERNEAIEQIRCCFASYQHIPEEQILKVGEGKLSLENFAVAIRKKELPSNVIVVGEKFSFTWRNPFRWKNPLAASLKKFGITPEYLGSAASSFASAFPY
jgi:hypothetical protein